MKINKKLIKELTDYLNEYNLTELEYGDGNTKIKVSKNNNLSSLPANSIPKKSENKIQLEEISGTAIKSPIIGTAYLAPEPGAKKFVEPGKKIKKGDTVMIVEAMKTMNHVPSPSDGVVKNVQVEDGQPVEYGQTLVILE
tara:strand:+ start:1587 stop:2006 length:420 start_codon:yes stop_codon:yes gene_type:complete